MPEAVDGTVSLTFVGGAGLGTEWPLQVLRSCVTILD